MNKRDIAKTAVTIIVATTVGTVVSKTLLANVPSSRNLKIAEMTGALTGAVVADKIHLRTDMYVDRAFNRIAFKKNPFKK